MTDALTSMLNAGSSSGMGEIFAQGAIDFGQQFLQNYFDRKSAKKQRQWDLYMWNLNNEYNKPINVMKRLKEAGLNPALMYGSGSAGMGISSSVPSGGGRFPSTKVPGIDLLSLLKFKQDFEAKGQDIANSKAQNVILQEKAKTERANAQLKTKSIDLLKANLSQNEERVRVLKHNLAYAKSHNLPVGTVETLQNQYLGAVRDLARGVVFGLTYGGANVYSGFQSHFSNARFNQMHDIPVVSAFDDLPGS